MDRELSKEYLKKKRVQTGIKILLPVVIVCALGFYTLGWIRPQVDLEKTLTFVAERGAVENSFVSNGVVEAYYQEVLTSTLSTDVLEILHAPGDLVGPQDTLLVPDVTVLESSFKEISNEIALKENRIRRSQEELYAKEAELKSELKMDSIRIEQLKTNLKNENYLFEIGGGSMQKVNQAKIDFQLALIERENQLLEFESFMRLQELDLESMQLELAIKEQVRTKISRKLEKAFIHPKINGVITSVLVEPGQYISEGQALAHVADANRFKIEGDISSRYADRIYPGQPVIVEINDSLLQGQISAVSPSVENGTLNYTVNLNNPSHRMLRSKLRVEVRLILSVNPSAIRLANSDYYFGAGNVKMFVLKGDQLEKRNVKLGGANFDYVEVISGIKEGETVVISRSFNQEYQSYNSIQCVN
ncbi:MAG: HlyD family efflux transporter periplasmic adaptor subunit [Bacteroidales bacterium]|nr:HlyD family efflux transporter periplasmic adaptor subunit [Bacteroidales bacterium]